MGGLARIGAKLRQARCLYRHPRTPRAAKRLLWLALGYAASPIDLIPDWIPVLGHIDDLIVVPTLLWFAWRLIPEDVRDECRPNAVN